MEDKGKLILKRGFPQGFVARMATHAETLHRIRLGQSDVEHHHFPDYGIRGEGRFLLCIASCKSRFPNWWSVAS